MPEPPKQGRRRRLRFFLCCFRPQVKDDIKEQPEEPPPPPPPPRPPPPPPPPRPPGPPPPPKGGGPPPPPVKKLNVRHLQWKGLKDADQDSLWARDALDLDLDEEELLDVFGTKVAPKPVQTKTAKPKKTVVRLLESKKAQNLEIATKSLKLEPAELVVAILRVDTTILGELSESLVDALLKYSPSKDEAAKLKEYKGPFEELGPAEQLWLSLIPVVRLEKKLRVLRFRSFLAERARPVEDKIKFVISMSQKVQGSQKLPAVLRVVLAIGNKLNQGTNRAKAKGITPEDLIIAGRTKGFMQYLCKVVAERRSELLDFWEEFVDEGRNLLADTLKVDRDGLESQVKELEKGMVEVVEELGKLKEEKEADDVEFASREREKMTCEDENGKRRRQEEDLRKAAETEKMLVEDMRVKKERAEEQARQGKERAAMEWEDNEGRKRLEGDWLKRRKETAFMFLEDREVERERVSLLFLEKVEKRRQEHEEMLRRLEEAAREEAERLERERLERERMEQEEKERKEEEERVRRVRLEEEERERKEKEERDRREKEEKERQEREEEERLEKEREEAKRLEEELREKEERDRLEREEEERKQLEEKERLDREERDGALALLQQKLKSGEIKVMQDRDSSQDTKGKAKLVDISLEKETMIDMDFSPEMEEWGETNYELARTGNKNQNIVAQSLAVWLNGQYKEVDDESVPPHEGQFETKKCDVISDGLQDVSGEVRMQPMNGLELSFSSFIEQNGDHKKDSAVELAGKGEQHVEALERSSGDLNGHSQREAKVEGESIRGESTATFLEGMKVEEVSSGVPENNGTERGQGSAQIPDGGVQMQAVTGNGGGQHREEAVTSNGGSAEGIEKAKEEVVEEEETVEQRNARQEREWQEEAERERKEAEERHERENANREQRAKERQERMEKARKEAEERAKQEKLEQELSIVREWKRHRADVDSRAETFWAVEAFYLQEVEPTVNHLRQVMGHLGETSNALAKYFGVDPKTPCTEIFNVLYDFIELFKKAKIENENRKKAEAEKTRKQAELEARRKRAEENKKKLQEQELRRKRSVDIGRESMLKDNAERRDMSPSPISIPSRSPSPSIFSPITTPGGDTPSTHSTYSPFASLSPIGSPMLRSPSQTPPHTSPRGSVAMSASYPWSIDALGSVPSAPSSSGSVASPAGTPSPNSLLLSSPALDKFRKRAMSKESDSSDDDFDEERPRKARLHVGLRVNGSVQTITPPHLDHSLSAPGRVEEFKKARVRHALNGKANGILHSQLAGKGEGYSLLRAVVMQETRTIRAEDSPQGPSQTSLLVAYCLCIYWLVSPTFFKRARKRLASRKVLEFGQQLSLSERPSAAYDTASSSSSLPVSSHSPSAPFLPIQPSVSRKSRLSRSVSYAEDLEEEGDMSDAAS